ncbi:hypothetical protein LRH25_28280 [Ideonella azotifigens]|uniref:DUF4252 domain-containing protein n=1 Tax=Ideonella azotifigens TaxID=513160 RepID=A0ABN1KHG2_9BURK|nr:hypothetical protein [Ideonella azotifigens]MCD2344226.1 hypothetical protein [Ideonella azotifigens]
MDGTVGIRSAARAMLASALPLLLAACGHLLPSETQRTATSFESYEAAGQALQAVVPFKTTVNDLKALGFDIADSANVNVIPYPELVARLAPHPNIALDELDPGIRACIQAQMACRAYEFEIGVQQRQRVGDFWRDFLNFRRLTEVSGWHLRALLVIRSGVVLFSNFGGEPRVARSELRVNPLGPLQPSGEAAGAILTR